MQIRSQLIFVLALTLTSTITLAQPVTTAPATAAPAGAATKGRPAPNSRHALYYESMKTTVGLDADQQLKVEALITKADEDFRASRAALIPPPEVTKRMTETVKEIDAAKAAGNSRRVKELTDERTALMRGYIEKRDKLVQDMKARDELLKREISLLLTPEQLEKFNAFWPNRLTAMHQATKDPYDGLIRSATALKAATDRLGDLTPQQKSQLETVFKAYQESTRTQLKPHEEEQALRQLYTSAFAVFTEGQHQRVQTELTPKGVPPSGSTTTAPAVEPAKPVPPPMAP